MSTATAIPIVDTPVPPPSGWTDVLSGTDGPRYWDRIMLSEGARVQRYKHASTVVLVEITGLPRLARCGARVAERALVLAARRLAKEVRPSDHCARIDSVRFGVLLTETAEIAAINFVERARAACEKELRITSDFVGVAFGWASPPKGGDLSDAVAIADQRLSAELRAAT